MQKLKYLIFIPIIVSGLFLLFAPEVAPENFQPKEILDIVKNSDVIIIYNSGGWGNTPLEKAEDFAPIIEGIQQTFNKWGYESVVVPYIRTKNDLFGKITGIREFFNFFKYSSNDLADKIETLSRIFPDKKIIIAGLSAGGAFVNETMEKISGEVRDSVYAITTGVPFWEKTLISKNILRLDNKGGDPLAKGEIKTLLSSLFKAPFKWVMAKISGEDLTFSKALQIPGHEYKWDELRPEITSFLEGKFTSF